MIRDLTLLSTATSESRKETTVMMRARITRLAGALTLATLLTLTWLPGVAAAAEPVYPVMNTSEYPPDGIYFRNSPDWNNTSRITGLGVFAGDQVRLKCWENGTNVPRLDGGSNTVWYLADNVTRPTSPAGGNSGWLNAHFVNDGTGPNEVAPGVIRCGTAPPPITQPAPPTPNQPAPAIDRIAQTDRLLWNSAMSVFLQAKKVGLYYPELRYDSDGCSVPPGSPGMETNPTGLNPTATISAARAGGTTSATATTRLRTASTKPSACGSTTTSNATCTTYAINTTAYRHTKAFSAADWQTLTTARCVNSVPEPYSPGPNITLRPQHSATRLNHIESGRSWCPPTNAKSKSTHQHWTRWVETAPACGPVRSRNCLRYHDVSAQIPRTTPGASPARDHNLGRYPVTASTGIPRHRCSAGRPTATPISRDSFYGGPEAARL